MPHLDAAYTLARYLTHDAAEAEDAVQDAVLRAVRYLHSLRADNEARAWLLAIVRRECYGGRRRRLDTVAFDDVPELRLVDTAESPERSADRGILRERISRAVSALPDAMREAIVLREIQQCSYEEIATITEVPVGTVMSRLSRARERLAALLGDLSTYGEDVG